MGFDIREWLKQTGPRVRKWRDEGCNGVNIRRTYALFDFASYHLRKGESFPFSLIECGDEGLLCEDCVDSTLASVVVKWGFPLTKERGFRVRKLSYCNECFVVWLQNRECRGRWVPSLAQEWLESLSPVVFDAVAERRRQQRSRYAQRFKERLAKGDLSALRIRARRIDHGRRQEPKSAFVESSVGVSSTALALQEFFANEQKRRAA